MLTYREVNRDEIKAVMSLCNRTFTGEQEIPENLNNIPDKKKRCWYCAEENEQIIGIIALFMEDDGWHAGRFALEREYRNKGIGSNLIFYAFREAFHTGIDEIILEGRPATVASVLQANSRIRYYPVYVKTRESLRQGLSRNLLFHPQNRMYPSTEDRNL